MLDRTPYKEAGYIRKRFISILREHRNENIDDYFDLCSVRCCDLDEYVAGTCCDFGMIAVDYWW